MPTSENDIPAAPPLERGADSVRARQRAAALDAKDVPRADVDQGRDATLRTLRAALVRDIDTSIDNLARTDAGESAREHLEVLRSLLRAQATAYLEHCIARRATLVSHTSTMYAGEVGAPGVISTTFRGLLEGGAMTNGQGAKLAQLLSDRRTLVICGDRATGKSTLLNSLFDLVPMDDRLVAIERGPDLPTLKERSFCVRLGVDGTTDLQALFAKARRMNPGRLVIGEMHAGEVREFFGLLADDPGVCGLATLRADSARHAVDAVVAAFDDDARAPDLVARVRPVFVQMRSDEKSRPRLAAIWSIEGPDDEGLVLREVPTGPSAASELAAET